MGGKRGSGKWLNPLFTKRNTDLLGVSQGNILRSAQLIMLALFFFCAGILFSPAVKPQVSMGMGDQFQTGPPASSAATISNNLIPTNELESAINIADDKLVGDDNFKTKINADETYFQFKDENGEEYRITSSMEKAIAENQNEGIEIPINDKPANEINREKIKYNDVIENVDIEQQVYNGKIKENIIIKDKNAPTTFQYSLNLSGNLELKDLDGKLSLTKINTDEVLVEIENPFAVDSNRQRYDFKYDVSGNNIILEPAADISNASYPLVIDPTYTIQTSIGGAQSPTQHNGGRRIARDSSGNLYVVYQRNDGTQVNIFIAKSTDSGQTWSETQLSSESDYIQRYPAIAIDGNNYIHIVWQGKTADSGISYQIFYRKYTTSWQAAVNLTGDDGYDQLDPVVAVDSGNNVHVAWTGKDSTYTSTYVLRYAKYTSSWSSISDLTSVTARYPSIAVDYQDHIHIAFSGSYTGASGSYEIRHVEYVSSWGTIDNLTNYSTLQNYPEIAISDNGNIYIAWMYTNGSNVKEVRFIKYTNSWQSIETLSTDSSYDQLYPTVSTDASNNINIFWWADCTDCGGYTQVWFRQYTSTWSSVTNISNTMGSAIYTYPSSLWASNPVVSESKTNRVSVGYSLMVMNGSTAKYQPSDDLSWVDPPSTTAPTVTSEAASSVGTTTATLNGTITDTGGENATIRGFKYSTVGEQDDSDTHDDGDYSTGAYTKLLSSLTANTTYYVRAYATNSAGTGYGSWVNFTTLESIDITGTCKQSDESTNCADTETVKVAVNGVLQEQTGTTSSGSWTISGITKPSASDVITVFIDGVSDDNEANAVTVYDGSGNISGIKLYERHLSLGSDDNQTITSSNISQYDNSVSSDEDIFFEVDGSSNLTLPETGTQTSTDQTLYINSSNTYRPASGGGVTVATAKLSVPSGAIFTADSNTIKINYYGTSVSVAGTFNADTSNFNYVSTAGNTNIAATTYYNLGLGTDSDSSTGRYFNLSAGTTTVTNVLTVGNASSSNNDTFSLESGTLNLSGSGTPYVQTAKGAFYCSLGTFKYTGSSSTNVAALTYYNLGVGTDADSNAANYTLAGNVSINRTLTIGNASSGASDTLSASDKNITFNSSADTVFTITSKGIFDPGTGIVYYFGDASTTITATNYYNLYVNPTITSTRSFTTESGTTSVTNDMIINPLAAISSKTFNFALGGDLNITGSLTVSQTNTAVNTTSTSASNYTLSAGSLIVSNSATLTLNGSTVNIDGDITNTGTINSTSANLTVVGDFSNSGGTFNDNSGSVILNGSSLQTLTAGGTDSSHDFYDLTITNASVSGVVLADSLTVNHTFTDTTSNSKITFTAGETYSLNTVNIAGLMGKLIDLVSSSTSNWIFNATTITQVSYVNVEYSTNSGTSFCATYSTGSNTTDWDISVTDSCITAPTLTTEAASSVGTTTATLNGTIADTGGENATIRGFKYSTVGEQDDSDIHDDGDYSTGAYTKLLSSLTANTTYYVRAYATNSAGTGYGSWVNFTTNVPSIYLETTSSSGAESIASANITVVISDISGTNSSVDYTVTGTATGGGVDYTLANGTATVTAGASSTNINLTVISDSLYESNETVILTLSNPTNASLGANDEFIYTITNDDSQPTIAFSSSSSSGSEATTPVSIEISLSAASGFDSSVDYTVTGTATGGGVDYTLANGTATVTAGATTTNISLSVVNDILDETDETVILTLSNPTNASLGATTEYTYTITDNDDPPTIAFSSDSGNGLESVSPVGITVSLSAVSGKDVTIDYVASDGTATGGGVDYTLTSGTLTISAGESSGNITLSVVNDTLDEDNETVTLTLSDPTNASLGATTEYTYTITDNDDPPTVGFSSSTGSGLESTTSVDISVNLSAASSKIITVDYTVTGTATGGGVDYTLTSGTLTISAGESSGNITLSVVNDTLDETDETVILTLSNPTNASLSAVSQYAYTIVDNDSTTTNDNTQTTTESSTVTTANQTTSGSVTGDSSTSANSPSNTTLSTSNEIQESQNNSDLSSYNLQIQVVDSNHNPIAGARVELHSDVKVTTSDENGYAYFTGVVPGSHKVFVSYNGYSGQQEVSVGGATEKVELTFVAQPETSKKWQWILTGIAVGIVLLLIIFWFRKRLLK